MLNSGVFIMSMVFTNNYYQDKLDEIIKDNHPSVKTEAKPIIINGLDPHSDKIFGLGEWSGCSSRAWPYAYAQKDHAHPEIFLTIQKIILYVSENWHRINKIIDTKSNEQDKKIRELSILINSQKTIIENMKSKLLIQEKIQYELQENIKQILQGCPPPPTPVSLKEIIENTVFDGEIFYDTEID